MTTRTTGRVLALAALLALAACGDDDDDGGGFTVGGQLTGLAGTVVLRNNGGDDLILAGNQNFSFDRAMSDGAGYSVTVATQPEGQHCVVTDGSGTVSGADVTSVRVRCSTAFTIGGTVSGLSGTLVLRNNLGDDLALASNGAFAFATPLSNAAAYSVSVAGQPGGQSCTVAQGVGTVAGADVTSVAVDCASNPAGAPAAPEASVSYGLKSLLLDWGAVSGATHYQVWKNPDGASGYSQTGGDLTTTAYTEELAVHLEDWREARYMVAACNASGCAFSGDITGLDALQTIGYLKASGPGAYDQFGWSVALSADGATLAIGALGEDSAATGFDGDETDDCADAAPVNCAADSGAVYVFVRTAVGAWSQQAYLKASNTEKSDGFGQSLALSGDGDTLAVGAIGEDSADAGDEADNTVSNAGAAYVFVRSGSTWAQQAYIKASNANLGDGFGRSVTLSAGGDTLAVGADLEDGADAGDDTDNSAADAGAAYVYTRSGSAWAQQAYIKASNAGIGDKFGYSLALSADGDTLAAGAFGEASAASGIGGDQADNTAASAGAVYVFTRTASVWSQQAYVKASNAEGLDRFGWSVALSGDGDTLAVGANMEDSLATGVGGDETGATAPNSGAVYVFARSGAAWSQQAYVKASNTGSGDNFGHGVALSDDGDTLAVGTFTEAGTASGIGGDESSNTATFAGAAYVFARSGGAWSQRNYVKALNTEAVDRFGWSLALSGDGATLAVGAISEDGSAAGVGGDPGDNTVEDAGAAYLY